ncbi:TPA: hypothetical protein ACH3X1_005900 [Trebouxia sp. C0004]
MMRQMRFMSKISLVLETLSIAQWTFLHTWLLSKTPLSSCLGSSRFMRKITGYEQYSEHVHAVNWVLRVIRISECCYARCNAGVCYQRSVPRPFFILDLMRRSVQRSLTCRNPSTSLEQGFRVRVMHPAHDPASST